MADWLILSHINDQFLFTDSLFGGTAFPIFIYRFPIFIFICVQQQVCTYLHYSSNIREKGMHYMYRILIRLWTLCLAAMSEKWLRRAATFGVLVPSALYMVSSTVGSAMLGCTFVAGGSWEYSGFVAAIVQQVQNWSLAGGALTSCCPRKRHVAGGCYRQHAGLSCV
jgi:hypothetical protein